MFGLFKKDSSEISHGKINTLALTAIKVSFELTCAVTGLTSKLDGKNFYFLFGESLALNTCLIQMRAQGKYKFTAQALGSFIESLLEEYKAFYHADLPMKIECAGLPLTKDVFELVLDPFFTSRVYNYCNRDYRSLGIAEETFNTIAKAHGYVPALVKGTSDDMALLMYQISVFSFMFSNPPLDNQKAAQFLNICKNMRAVSIRLFDNTLTSSL